MKNLLKYLTLQLITAVGIYLLLFILGEALAVIGWLIIIAAAILFLYLRKNKGKGPWWWEKAKWKMKCVLCGRDR